MYSQPWSTMGILRLLLASSGLAPGDQQEISHQIGEFRETPRDKTKAEKISELEEKRIQGYMLVPSNRAYV